MGARTAIEDDQRAIVAPHLNTRRVAAVAQRDWTRLRQRSAGTPKPDIHPCTLACLRGAAPRTVRTTPVPVSLIASLDAPNICAERGQSAMSALGHKRTSHGRLGQVRFAPESGHWRAGLGMSALCQERTLTRQRGAS